jgi:hypothetical protein
VRNLRHWCGLILLYWVVPTIASAVYSTPSHTEEDELIQSILRRAHRERIGLTITAIALFALAIVKAIALAIDASRKGETDAE